jgi:hypothetical protein
MTVDLEIAIVGEGAATELSALYEWLRREPDLRPIVSFKNIAPAPGTLGLDGVLIAAVSGGGALSVLAASLKTFFTLPRRSDLHLVFKTPGKESITLDAKNLRDGEGPELIREAAKLLDDGK